MLSIFYFPSCFLNDQTKKSVFLGVLLSFPPWNPWTKQSLRKALVFLWLTRKLVRKIKGKDIIGKMNMFCFILWVTSLPFFFCYNHILRIFNFVWVWRKHEGTSFPFPPTFSFHSHNLQTKDSPRKTLFFVWFIRKIVRKKKIQWEIN